MELNTKYFGAVEYSEEDVLNFSDGLFGFEEEKNFLLLPFAGSDGNLLCLQSLQTSFLAFVVMNPFSLNPAYAPVLSEEELRLMEVNQSEDLCYYVLCVIKDPIKDSTVNFRCPVVINPDTRKAIQVILDTGEYHMQHCLSEFHTGEGIPC